VKSRPRRLIPIGSIVSLLTLSLVLPGAANAQDEAELTQIDRAIGDINRCLASTEEPVLDVYFLMDGSGSLADDNGRPGADPDGIRFDAVQESIAPLAELAAADVEVNVAAGTFGNDATQVLPWTQVDPESATALGDQIKTDLESSFNRENTNWVAGLALAEEQLEIARQSGPRCQTLIWITDGGINLTNDSQVNADGIAEICGVNPTEFGEAKALGSMFRLRNSGVVVLGILLSDPKSPNESRTTYFAPIVEGSGRVDAEYFGGGNGDFACGRAQIGATGAAIPAETPSDLADELWAISTCITDNCLTGEFFGDPLGQDADGNWILPVPSGVAVAVIRPRSDDISITDPLGQVACSGAEECGLLDGSMSLDVLGNPGLWLLDTGSDRSPLSRFLPEITVTISVPDDLVSEEAADVRGVAEQAGAPLRADLYDSTDWSWEFIGDDGSESSGSGDQSGLLEGLAPAVGGLLTVTFAADVAQTEADGVVIPSVDLSYEVVRPLRVRPVGDYPSLIGGTGASRDLVVFPTIEGVGESTATIAVQGPESGAGLVCLNAPTIASDPGADEVGRTLTFSSEFDCLSGGTEIGAGERLEIPVTVAADTQFSGIARGKINVQVEPSDGGRAFPEAVDFEVPSTLERNTGAAFATIVILTLLGLLLPYLGLLWFARRQASFSQDLDGARYASLPIRLTPEGLVSIGEMPVSEYSFIYMDRSAVQREVSTAALTHRIEPPRIWPFAPIKCEAVGPSNSLVVSNLSGDLNPMASRAPSSQALPDVFVAYFDRPDVASAPTTTVNDWGAPATMAATSGIALDDSVLEGQLVVILPESGNPADAAERALAKARVWPRWQEVFTAVKNASRPAAPAGATGPGSAPQPPPREDPLSDW